MAVVGSTASQARPGRGNHHKKHGSTTMASWVARHKWMVLAVLATAAVTRQLTIVSVLHSCGSHNGSTIQSSLAAFAEGGGATKSKPNEISSTSKPSKLKKKVNYNFQHVPSRVWKIFDHPFPCYPPGEDETNGYQLVDPAHEGILFQRPTKVGSTTMTNVVMRLAHTRAAIAREALEEELHNKTTKQQKLIRRAHQKLWKTPERCKHRSNHGNALDLEYPKRDRTKSFLFGLVREPVRRALSIYFHFRVSHLPEDPTDANFQAYTLLSSNDLIKDMTFDPSVFGKIREEAHRIRDGYTGNETATKEQFTVNYTSIVEKILDDYDFIGVTERMDESLVAIKLLLDLSVEEILYAKTSRASGGWSNAVPPRACMYLVPPFLSDGMDAFFHDRNARWIGFSRGDALLHQAASASLDRTIAEVFGKEKFAQELAEFRNARAYAQAVCSEPGRVVGMCDATGAKTAPENKTCYIWGEGCDYQCLNEHVPHPLPQSVLDGTEVYRPKNGGSG